ncbi:hypothetical protein QAD02_006200 [Eretmocerus hayati]|uniref:Uncharacterized protein n=1 Tax=Eretmocerus hayati TaxID=131215 RepID=A0ACC2N0B2_9HYME|nr:hypothetical protein QAD02_006200 [Eretmocerus hayati]
MISCNISIFCILFGISNIIVSNSEPLGGDYVKKVSQNNFDFVVSIAHSDESLSWKEGHFCTGTLFTYKHILTSEKCLFGKSANEIVLYIGSPHVKRAKKYQACKLITHSSWVAEVDNEVTTIGSENIGVITLCKIMKPHKIRPASISFASDNRRPGAKAVVAGWGSLKDGSKSMYLRKASVAVLGQNDCQKETNGRFTDGQVLCTSATPYVMTKPGDTGGPLFDQQDRLIAISTGTWFMGIQNPDSVINTHLNLLNYRRFLSNFIRIYDASS